MLETYAPGKTTEEQVERKPKLDLRVSTFKDLGISIEHDRLGLAQASVMLIRDQTPDLDAVNYTFLVPDHPLLGQHLIDVFNSVAKHQDPKSEVISDWLLRERARRRPLDSKGDESESASLFQQHWNSPRIGPYFRQFHEEIGRYITAARNSTHDAIFSAIPRFVLTMDGENYIKEHYSTLRDNALKFWGWSTASTIAYYFYREGEPFMDFLSHQSDLPQIDWRKNSRASRYLWRKSLRPQMKDHTLGFLELLSEDEQKEFALDDTLRHEGRVLIDTVNRRVWQRKDGLDMAFAEDGTLVLHADSGDSVRMQPIDDPYTGVWLNPIQYEFSEDYLRWGIYPAFGWTYHNGERQVMDKTEVKRYTKEAGFKHFRRIGVDAGRIWATYFSPQVTEKVPQSGRLRADGSSNFLTGAQVPTALLFPALERDLLSNKNPVLPVLENAFS